MYLKNKLLHKIIPKNYHVLAKAKIVLIDGLIFLKTSISLSCLNRITKSIVLIE